jgi:hypothetical protein
MRMHRAASQQRKQTMTSHQAALADFASRQTERAARADAELQHLKQAVIAPLRVAGIATVEIRFDGCGDSGAVEECTFFDTTGKDVPCPEVTIGAVAEERDEGVSQCHSTTLQTALESLAYLALERHHPGWEINEGAGGELVIGVAEASFTLECSLRYTSTEDHSTEL